MSSGLLTSSQLEVAQYSFWGSKAIEESTVDVRHDIDDAQAKRWNGFAGRAWVDAQEALDAMFEPLQEQLVEAVSTAASTRVLDVGCGTGSTTIAVARLLGPMGRPVGIDISDPMIAAARARAERERGAADFICADAQVHVFEPASFDLIISRFGVMFFGDAVQAFTNLRRAATGDAGLRLIAWRSASENPFMTTAERAARPLLPDLPVRKAGAPGQFAFSNARRVHSILERSSWTDIDIRPIDVVCTLAEKELTRYLARLGPVGLHLERADERMRARVVETVRTAFDEYVTGTRVRFTAACWMITARAG
jgi:SAM-dependent methyltransferase